MKSKIKHIEGAVKQFDITISKKTVDETFDKVINDIKKSANIAGFRQGKAPDDLVIKQHGQDAHDEVKKILIPQAYQQVLEEHNVDPVSYPDISDVKMTDAGEIKFSVKVDAHPEINLKKYKGMKVSSQKLSVKDEEVDQALSSIRNMNAEFEDVDRSLKKGDFAICDVETIEGEKIISKKREDMWVQVDKEESLLGMGEELQDLKKGDTKDIDVTLPETYPDKKFAGKKAVFKVEIKQTKEKKLPELDDEFAKKVGKDTMAEVKEEIHKQLLERKEAENKIGLKTQLIEQLLKTHAFEPPSSMVERQLKVFMEKAEADLAKKGVDKKELEAHKEKLKEQLYKEAENKVRTYFILNMIAEKEKVTVEPQEIDDWLKALAASYGQDFENVKKYYSEHNLTGGLVEQLREEKTLDLILAEAEITEKK